MSISSEGEGEDGPVVLQLKKWQDSTFQFDLSEFHEGFISPSRRMLLLLSNKYEATLVSFSSGTLSESISGSDSTDFSDTKSKFESHSVISCVKSISWGCFCESSGQLEDFIFNELLIMSGERGIFVHLFRVPDKVKLTDPTPIIAALNGKWVEWGPPQELDTDSKNRFRTYFTEVESGVVENGKYMTKFPLNIAVPSSAMALSFDLYGNILEYLNWRGFSCRSSYGCSRVFSSSCNQLIGLILDLEVTGVEDSEDMGDPCKLLLVVVRIHQCGLEWVFCEDLNKSFFEEPGSTTKWVDFQLSENFLFCLNVSGLIALWDLNTGNLLVRSDILTSEIIAIRSFKRFLRASGSVLLGVIDELGVIYLASLDEIISDKALVGSSSDLYLDPLIAWRVAGHEIGALALGSIMSKDQEMRPLEAMRLWKKRKQNYGSGEMYPSGFDTWSNSGSKIVKGFNLLRRVFLPPYQARDEMFACLSPFGILRLVVNRESTKGKGAKVVHTELHVGPLQNKETYSDRDSIGCFFKGCLYLITKDGVSVVLPSISVPNQFENSITLEVASESRGNLRPWQIEVLDRVHLYEGSVEADRLCLENGWDLRVSRMRQMQLALHYSKFDEIEQSLSKLVDVDLAEEGVLRLLFASVYPIFVRVASENEIVFATRLISLAASFATKMIRKYALLDQNMNDSYSGRLCEMAYFLEVIRDLQSRVSAKCKKLVDKEVDDTNSRDPGTETLPDASNDDEFYSSNNNLALTLAEPSTELVEQAGIRQLFIPENVKDMIARWELSNLDLKSVVKDALKSGRLPLAVHQLRLLHQKDDDTAVSSSDEKSHNAFNEVREIGISIAYDLFVQGETDLAVATLEKLGEDIELVLRQLLFGTARRSLRVRIIDQMKKRGFLRLDETRILERILLIERLYPRSSFWVTYQRSQRDLSEHTSLALYVNDSPIFCGEVDGAILGVWADISTYTELPEPSESTTPGGYWACAAAWSDAWDQRTIDRVVLDQHYQMEIQVPWESQFEYHVAHNNLQEILDLLDTIPIHLQSEGILVVNLRNISATQRQGLYICAGEEIEPSYIDVPGVIILRHPYFKNGTLWLRTLIEKKLAKRNIFLRDQWEDTGEIVTVLARAGLMFNISEASDMNNTSDEKSLQIQEVEDPPDTKLSDEGFHKLVIHFCVQNELPYLLDFYLDHHNLVGDHNSLHVLLDAAGDCQWAKWLLFSRLRGYEYEASLSNARWKLSRNLGSGGSGGNFLEIEEKINKIDDLIAEGVGEIAALATLMYATFPIENCLSLETLDRPSLREYPTMLKSLISACSDRDYSRPTDATKVLGNRVLSEYFNWRYGVFYSTGGDASLLQILQAAFPKPVRRLVQLFVQGPFSLQVMEFEKETLNMSDEFLVRCLRHSILKIAGDNKTDPIVLEALVQKSIEKELFSAEEKGFKVEQDLNRGRVLAVFSSLIGKRALELRSTDPRLDQSVKPNVVFDTQKFLRPLNQSERSVLQWVVPLAIRSFDDSSVVTSCGFFFELCGISFEMLCLDINALRRISSKYGRANKTLALDLAKELAEEYIKYDYLEINSQNQKMPPSKTLVNILHYLEEASLPVIEEEDNCGTWLKTGTGDASHLRSKQSEASRYWSLVNDFCQVHHLPISTKYLALLASNNDWVGFLMEAQLGSFSADVVSQVATKELKDARLRAHVLTVLRSMKSAPKKIDDEGYLSANEESNTPAELFMVVTQCEKQKFPGEALLRKARMMRWPFLAIVASCFSDISTLSCAAFWLEITGSRLSLIKADKIILEIAKNVGLAIEHTNKLPPEEYNVRTTFDRQNAKRQRISEPAPQDSCLTSTSDNANVQSSILMIVSQEATISDERKKTEEALGLLAEMVVLFCKKQMFLPLLRAFELFLPLCPLLSLIRSLQAFSQMRLAEASAHLAAFSARTKEEQSHTQPALLHDELLNQSPWLSSTAVNAADAVLSTCPTLYEKRSLLQLLASADFGDDGSLAAYFKRLYWKINLAESDLKTDWFDKLDDGALLTELEKKGRWEEARSWARQLSASNASWKSAVHHVTESQAEAMVSEWKEFLWDFPQERAALWGHCQALFVRYSFPPLQAGSFFLKHAEAIEKEIPARELHEMLLLSLQWLSGTITQIPPVYPLHLLREIETRVWLLAVESETQSNPENEPTSPSSVQNLSVKTSLSFIEQTAKVVSKMDSHINATHTQVAERSSGIFRENNITLSAASAGSRTKRKGKLYHPLRHTINENFETSDEISSSEGTNLGVAISGWEERVGQVEMERAVLSLLEFGQITAAKQLQHKLSPTQVPEELNLIDSVLKLAKFASSNGGGEISLSVLDEAVRSVLRSLDLPIEQNKVDPSQALDALSRKCGEGRGRGLCLRVIAVVRAAMVLGLTFAEAFGKQPLELLQLLSLKAQVSIEEATLLVETYSPPPPSIALILAESFLKGLLAAHRGGYLENQKEEGPEPLLWRSSDFLKWAKLCPSESEIGHALMRVVMTGQVPRACEVEILILAHHFYMSSACLDGVDVLVTFVANRVESYVLEDDFSSLARLVTGVANFRSFSFILDILIESGQLELLLEKYSVAAETATGSVAAVRGIRMTVLTSLKRYNPHDLDAFAMVYNHFDMKHDAAKLLESRSTNRIHHWLSLKDRDRREHSGELLDSMCHLIEAGETLSTIDAGQRTHRACARASLLTLQIRIPDITWVQLSETNARRILVEQSRFQEALVVAEAYGLNQPMEWAPVFWTLMLKPDLLEQFVAEFVAVLPLQPSMLHELARFYRSEVSARGDQKHFSVWLSPGGLPAEWVKHLDRSFRSVLKRTRDLRVRMQLAVYATGFGDVVEACLKVLDKVPDNAGPLVLRRGHGGAYLPLM